MTGACPLWAEKSGLWPDDAALDASFVPVEPKTAPVGLGTLLATSIP